MFRLRAPSVPSSPRHSLAPSLEVTQEDNEGQRRKSLSESRLDALILPRGKHEPSTPGPDGARCDDEEHVFLK